MDGKDDFVKALADQRVKDVKRIVDLARQLAKERHSGMAMLVSKNLDIADRDKRIADLERRLNERDVATYSEEIQRLHDRIADLLADNIKLAELVEDNIKLSDRIAELEGKGDA